MGRFAFGKNWRRFLELVDEGRIEAAELSLKQMLDFDNLKGKTFLDAGSGSGLFSLAARRLHARVFSFDYDPDSVACTRELKRKFCSADQDWHIEQGSALDRSYLDGLGNFDVVYSWGVLHHTGDMWNALENMSSLVKLGGKLFIAIYNDQGRMSDLWRVVKKTYNRMPPRLRFVILWPAGGAIVAGMTFKDLLRFRRLRIMTQSYDGRGMSLWTDITDWVGGYPFEVASTGQIIGFYQQRGFRVDRLLSCGRKLGCNQYVFTKMQPN